MARKIDERIIKEAIRLYESGLTVPVICKDRPISKSVLYRALHSKGLKPTDLMRRGLRGNANRRLTDDKEVEVASEYLSGKSMKLISEEVGVNMATVRNALKRQGVPSRRRGNTFRSFTQEQRIDMARRWQNGESQTAIARVYNTHQTLISNILSFYGYTIEKRHPKGDKHGSWKGGRHEDKGYIFITIEHDHPFASMRNSGCYVLEHRLVMAQYLGRTLTNNETVHHRNGDKSDNRIENLELRMGKHGKGVTMACADCGSVNIIVT